MSDFKTLCEMDVGSLIKTVLGIKGAGEVAQPEPPEQQAFVIQPDCGIGNTGKINGNSGKNIQVTKSEDGGIIVKSADMNINLSKEVAEAITQFLKGGLKEDYQGAGDEHPMEQEAIEELNRKRRFYIEKYNVKDPKMQTVLDYAMESGYLIGKAIGNMLTKRGLL